MLASALTSDGNGAATFVNGIVSFRSVQTSPEDRLFAWLAHSSASDLTPAVSAGLRHVLLAAVDDASRVGEERHGTLVSFTTTAGGRRRTLELDRRGTLVMLARWNPNGELADASVRIPDRSWLVIEPRATDTTPWGLSDRLWRAERPGLENRERAITVFSSVDYAGIHRIPSLAEPSRLPPGGGTAVLNFVATLAQDQRAAAIDYRGPYPTEQLFLALLESFRYDRSADDPLAAFMTGALGWTPAPHERLFADAGAYVQVRERVEKVVWHGRTYYRPDWQHIARQTARRVRDVPGGACCSLWALGRPIEDHITVTACGDIEILPRRRETAACRDLAVTVRDGVIEVVVAASAPPLAEFIRDCGRRITMEWRSLDADLVDVRPDRVSFSSAFRNAARTVIDAAADRRARLGAALATITEMAGVVGDALRARAQAAIAAQPEARQRALLLGEEPRPVDASRITAALEALLADVAAEPPARNPSSGGVDDEPDVEDDEGRNRHC